MSDDKAIIISLCDINKSFRQGDTNIHVLKNASLEIKKGEIIALVGESGCGKSTFIQIAGLLDIPDSGKIIINGVDATGVSDKKRTKIREQKIGFVYQQHHLLSEFSALENVMLPQIIAGKNKKQVLVKARNLLDSFGLDDRYIHRPSELSGGEQQRVAIARALANDPYILLADEPTGNLDPKTANDVFDMLLKRVREIGLSMLMVTHNMELASVADKIFTIENGHLSEIEI